MITGANLWDWQVFPHIIAGIIFQKGTAEGKLHDDYSTDKGSVSEQFLVR